MDKLTHNDIIRMNEIGKFIEENYADEISLNTLSIRFLMSKTTLRRHFYSHFNESVGSYLLRIRMQQAMMLITGRYHSISQICHAVGYTNRSAFTRAFTKFFGKSPLIYWKS